MPANYVLRAREKSLSGTTHYFIVATQGSLRLYPDNSNAVMRERSPVFFSYSTFS